MVAITEMKDKLLSYDEAFKRLEKSEPLRTTWISDGDRISFDFKDGWAENIATTHPDTLIEAFVTVNGKEYQMTLDAAVQAGSLNGIQKAYSLKVPPKLHVAHLDHWFSPEEIPERGYNLLHVGNAESVSAFAKPSIRPFSNLRLLESALDGIPEKYLEEEVQVDYKFSHSLRKTDIRLIVPGFLTQIKDTGIDSDEWSAGFHISNSLVGVSKTTIEGYLFRWICTNGATTEVGDVGGWSRKLNGQDDDVYGWAQSSVDDIFKGLPDYFDKIQGLTHLNIEHAINDIVSEVVEEFDVPVAQRLAIYEDLADAEGPVTMYTLMQAITQQANNEDISEGRADTLMRIGGAIPSNTFDPLKARVWREGHKAEPTSQNPYEVVVL